MNSRDAYIISIALHKRSFFGNTKYRYGMIVRKANSAREAELSHIDDCKKHFGRGWQVYYCEARALQDFFTVDVRLVEAVRQDALVSLLVDAFNILEEINNKGELTDDLKGKIKEFIEPKGGESESE